jgi:hypothetical protein
MEVSVTLIDADGNEWQDSPGHVPDGCIGAVAETPGEGFIAVAVTEGAEAIDENLGVYSAFGLAVEALRGNHRRE